MKSIELKWNDEGKTKIIGLESLQKIALLSSSELEHSTTVALSMGTTYQQIFPFWATQMDIDFSRIDFFPVDERKAHFETSESNWGEVYRRFLIPVHRKVNKHHFIQDSAEYASLLKKYFQYNELPFFDMVYLGVGSDGHTASLFPGYVYDPHCRDAVVNTIHPGTGQKRISLSGNVLTHACKCIVIILGEQKRNILQRVIAKDATLPIVQILSHRAFSLIYTEENLLD